MSEAEREAERKPEGRVWQESQGARREGLDVWGTDICKDIDENQWALSAKICIKSKFTLNITDKKRDK